MTAPTVAVVDTNGEEKIVQHNDDDTTNHEEEAQRVLAAYTQPFQKPSGTNCDVVKRAKELCTHALTRLDPTFTRSDGGDDEEFLKKCTTILCNFWKKRDKDSEIAFKGVLGILELCLSQCADQVNVFSHLLNQLGFQTVAFWRIAVPLIYESDLAYRTNYRDALLFSVALFDVNFSKNRLRELYAAVPGLRQSVLGIHAKRFGEKYRHMQMIRTRACSRLGSVQGSVENLQALENDVISDEHSECNSSEGGAVPQTSHHKQRVINVSNAPPVSVCRKESGCWEIQQGSGGLVACVDPVMSGDKDNVWLANLGINLAEESKRRNFERDLPPLSTNSIGLPIVQQARAGEVFHVLEDMGKNELTDNQKDVERDMSLLGVINDYNKSNYQLNPVIVSQDDYNAYYGGISNGILWPALHNLPEHILKDYDDPKLMNEHWCAYVRVNYQFGLNAARNSRPQDFIWIHDYHLMLTGQIMRSLDSNLEVGFFLHIPFQPPPEFMTKYRVVADPIIRGILRFNKVGFQTHRDRMAYVDVVKNHIPRARVKYDAIIDIFMVTYEGWTCSLGVFPVSIKIEDFLSIAREPTTVIAAQDIKKKLMGNSHPDGNLFFSVERFDYTKGIYEKLKAWKKMFETHPERIGKDVLYQVAVTNRRSVESYRKYQDDCLEMAEAVNNEIKSTEFPDWKPIVFDTDGLPRAMVIAHYLAMDIGVVTPAKDGMNLVAKEMMVCNPGASLMISSGAGTEVQLGLAGLYGEDGHFYHRVTEISDIDDFSDVFYRAAVEDKEIRKQHGKRINEFLCRHGIEEWSSAFLDPSWTHEVIRPSEVRQLADFYMLMAKTAEVRRQVVEAVLKGLPIRPHYTISLQNAMEALQNSCEEGTTRLILETNVSAEDPDGANLTARFEIADELEELQRDLAFLQLVQEEDIQNIERFIDETLAITHMDGPETYQEELNRANALLSSVEGEHFHYVFTDRDGTLKSYSCSYPTSIQPAYSAVIQAQFARRCAQFCAIVTTSPLVHIGILNMSTMPEGYYAYGASCGREWYFNPAMQFKDDTISEADIALLNKAFDKLEDLLENPYFRNFTWIGSGLQKHYGHISVAKQDVNNSIPNRKSRELYAEVARIVSEVDPAGTTLTLREGELELKIFTKAKMSGRIFNKGHGIRLLERKMGLKLNEGSILVCGDSETDIPMLEECLLVAAANVYTIWVTKDDALKEKVRSTCGRFNNTNVEFVSCPKVLLGSMAYATVRELKLRGLSDEED